MINSIKNISNEILDWGNGVTQSIGEERTDIKYWSSDPDHYAKLCEFLSLEKIEVYYFDGQVIEVNEARKLGLEMQEFIAINVNYPRILNLVDGFTKQKSHISIQYNTELLSGVKLQKVESIGIDGLADEILLNLGEVDGETVVKVSHSWTTDPENQIPAEADVIERTKTRTWINIDGTENPTKKVTKKYYDTQNKKKEEGKRRRGNILVMTQVNVVAILLYTGAATDQDDAEEKIGNLFTAHGGEFGTYIQGKGSDLYTAIQADTEQIWLNTLIGETASNAIGIDDSWHIKDLREYIIQKIKGLI